MSFLKPGIVKDLLPFEQLQVKQVAGCVLALEGELPSDTERDRHRPPVSLIWLLPDELQRCLCSST